MSDGTAAETETIDGFAFTVFAHSEDVLNFAVAGIQDMLNRNGINVQLAADFAPQTPTKLAAENLVLRVGMRIPSRSLIAQPVTVDSVLNHMTDDDFSSFYRRLDEIVSSRQGPLSAWWNETQQRSRESAERTPSETLIAPM